MVNNYANSSHVKEVVEKSNQLEKVIVGAPRPHESWRDLVLFSIVLGATLFVVTKVGRKFLGPSWLVKYIQDKSMINMKILPSISGKIGVEAHSDLDEFKKYWERRLEDQDRMLWEVMIKLNNLLTTNSTRDPIRTQQN